MISLVVGYCCGLCDRILVFEGAAIGIEEKGERRLQTDGSAGQGQGDRFRPELPVFPPSRRREARGRRGSHPWSQRYFGFSFVSYSDVATIAFLCMLLSYLPLPPSWFFACLQRDNMPFFVTYRLERCCSS